MDIFFVSDGVSENIEAEIIKNRANKPFWIFGIPFKSKTSEEFKNS